jgi:hypothetical protein
MKLFKYQMGSDEKLGVAADEKDAYENREKVGHTFRFLPVKITEVTLPGYDITLTPHEEEVEEGPEADAVEALESPDSDDNEEEPEEPSLIENMNIDQLKAFLDDKEIKYHHNTGEDKLRELALENV